MSNVALNASIPSPPPAAEHYRDLGDKSASGSDFAAIVNALGGEDAQPGARASNAKSVGDPEDARASHSKDPASSQHGAPSSDGAPNSQEPNSIDAGLAGLVLSALGSSASAQPTRSAPGSASSTSESVKAAAAWRASQAKDTASEPGDASSRDATSKSPKSNPIDAGLAGLVYGALGASANATPSPSAPGAAGANGARQGSSAQSSTAGATAPKGTANVALPGAVGTPQAIQTLASSDSSLGVSDLRTRTYLGVDSAAQTEAKNPAMRAQTRFAANMTMPARSTAAGTSPISDAAVTSIQNETSSEKRSNSDRQGSQTSPPRDPSPGPAASAIGSGASLATVSTANPPVISVGPITLDQLADSIATAASGLTAKATASPNSPATASVQASQPVKELQLNLDPADLGAVSVKMRLTDGKLSVVMEVSNPSTLKAVEGERETIATRLGSTAPSLESLVIKPTAMNQTNAETKNASDQKPDSRENAQSNENRDSQPNGQQPSGRENSAGRWNRQAPPVQPGSRGGFSDLLV
jgi:chemotaxis protein MotD